MKFTFLNGADGEQSSKRLFATGLMISFIAYIFINLYSGRALKDSLEEYFFYLVVAVYGGVVLERFAPRKIDRTETTSTEKTEVTKTV